MSQASKQLASTINIAQLMLESERDTVGITPAAIAAKVKQAAEIINATSPEPVDQEAAIAALIQRFSHWIGKDTTLEDKEGHTPWLNAARKKDWRYWQRYQTYLERKLSVDVVGALDDSTDKIVGLLEDPMREGSWDRRGLVVGHVQSGKTGNYSGLVCKAADAGYKIIIVLAGMHNNLRSQTQIRLEEAFLGYETSEDRSPGKPTGVGLIDSDPAIAPQCATTRADKGDFNATVQRHFAISPEAKPWLFVVKKNKTVLTQLLKWIRNHVANSKDNATGRRIVTNRPLLIIDDEADHASVDTGEQVIDADGKPDEDHQPKAINGLIRSILHAFEKKAYVGYTATPFANIFIHRRNETKDEGPDLFPQSFIINLAAPSNYVGPSRIFGLATEDGRVGGLPLMRNISDQVNTDEPGGWMPPKHNKEHVPVFMGQDILPTSLKEAIQSFMLACAARNLRGQSREHSSMLVHVTRFANVQKKVRSQVEAAVKKMAQRLARRVDHESLVEELKSLWERDFIPTSEAVAELVKEPGTPRIVPPWDDILAALPDTVADIKVKTINGTAKDALDYSEQEEKGLKVIAIGGDKLARGLTLEGLCTSYFVRTTKMYDTLMQMGRWFGYRPGYVDLCRLYTTEDLVEWFGHIADASEELREEFDAMADSGATPKEYGLKVQSHPVLLVTSPLKMRAAKSLQLSFSGELLETVAFFKDDAKLDANIDATNRLIAAMGAPSEVEPKRMRAGVPQQFNGLAWNDVPADHVADFLDAYLAHPGARKVKSKLLAEFVREMSSKSKELTSWTVALMDGGRGSNFDFDGGCSVNGMTQRAAKSEVKDRYSIGRLLSPRDEALDLDDAAWQAALAATKQAWKNSSSPTDIDSPDKEPDVPNGPAIRRIRGLGADGVPPAPERGLLLLYPLDPQLAGEGVFSSRKKPIMGFGLSFPASQSGVKVEYKVDHLIWSQWESEYGASE